MYTAHPTHGAGTRPNRTQLTTAARRTTLYAGQCVHQPREGRKRNRQALPPKKNGGGRGKRRENSPQPPNHPPTPPEAAIPPPPEGTEDRTPKEAQGDHPAKNGNTKRGTAAHWEKGHRNKQKKKKRESQQPSLKERGWGDRDHKARDRNTQKKNKKKEKLKKKKRKKPTSTTQPRRAGHSRDSGPAHTPTPHAGTGNRGGQAGRPHNHTRPISRPKPNPNHEHHKQLTLEGQHHKPCPNTPTQDHSQDWRG